MKITSTGALWAAGLALLLSACTTGSTPNPSSTSSTHGQPPSVSPSATPTTTSPEELAAARAEEVLRAYYRAWSSCTLDPPNAPITCYDNVAIATALNDRRNALTSAKAMQTRTTGDITPVSVTRTRVDLTNKVNETPPTVPKVVFRVCVDVSAFNILDKDGKSLVPADRKPRSVAEVSVLNYKYPDPVQWRVGLSTVVKDATC